MRTKILSKRALLIITLLGFVFLVALSLTPVLKSLIPGRSMLITENTATLQNQGQVNYEVTALPSGTKVNSDLPALLKIPSINVTASFEYVGLTPEGAMDVPKAPNEVAWFSLGPRPGENGSAVIAGHYNWKNNLPAVFDNLHKLRKGDVVFVKNGKGVTETFVVRETKIYGGDEIVPEVFGSSDGKAHLNLITCTGEWNKDKNTYSERLVVFTDKE